MEEPTKVIKRNGDVEEFNIEKINKVIYWACDGVKDVSLSDIEINAKLQIGDKITSSDVHEVLIKSAENLISLENPNYQIVAGRLLNYQLRKDVWGGKNPPKLYDLIEKNIQEGVYHSEILDLFSKTEIDKFDELICHDRDFDFDFCGIKQLCSKYLVKNRKSGKIYETPQFAYMLVSMLCAFSYEGKKRFNFVKSNYERFSKKKINLPTPLIAGVRTPVKQYASCDLTDVDDSIDGLIAANGAVVKATSQRFGIGLNIGRIRAGGSEIRNGEVIHTGVIPFLKWFESAVKSCHQNGIRGGGATVNIPIWHYEIEDVIQLKNNAGTDDNRVRSLDYCVHFSKLFYDRWLKNENVTLFSPHEVRDLYDAFGYEHFDELYLKCEKDKKIKMKKVIPMRELMTSFVKERIETGRIYVMNIDHVNQNSAWNKKVNMTNLCCVAGDTEVDIIDNNECKARKETVKNIVDSFEEGRYKVLSYNHEKKLTEYSEIEGAAMTRKDAELVRVSNYNCDRELFCTDDHKISTHRGYVEAKDLDASVGYISDKTGRVEDVYDIQVAKNNNFFADGILVHNCEINHPTIPLKSLDDKDGEIGICILSAINLLEISSDSDLEKTCDTIVRILDNIIDYQDYFVPAAENFAKNKRSLGVGITNLAALLAKNNLKYSDDAAPNFVDEIMEKIQFFLLKASNELAKEVGKCNHFDQSTYSQGVLPIDRYKKEVDSIVTRKSSMPWEELRLSIKEHGLRHCTMTAIMPVESTSIIQSSTNGMEPIRAHLLYKGSKANTVPVICPNYNAWKNKYELAFDLKDNIGNINIMAALQKWVDMSISGNTYYNYEHYEGGRLPDTKVIKELLYAYKMGIKTLYYNVTPDGDNQDAEKKEESTCESSGACAI